MLRNPPKDFTPVAMLGTAPVAFFVSACSLKFLIHD